METGINQQQLIQMINNEEDLFNKLLKEAEKINSIIIDLEQTKKAIIEIEKNPKKMMISLGTGVTIEVEVKNNKCLRLMGENLFVSDSTEGTKKWIDEKKEKLEEQLKNLEKNIYSTQEKIKNLNGIMDQFEMKKRELVNLTKK
ncbi:MAG: hypothetical protein PHQ98_00245 [Candidatus ainarchaeum sp.]|nr:hypothetical protein [Candidatus ainarchaeum sp.]